jgi:hypothetical protein
VELLVSVDDGLVNRGLARVRKAVRIVQSWGPSALRSGERNGGKTDRAEDRPFR